ncbi:putative nicotinamide mononucleotide adenylyltransferase [Grifola frondosa]|uniref:Putative nicotinamide mononucleotide adenylyltransferase n=1 Tax=Grifola frondosa TaxID=5627 RepID=A0A1C7M5B0_GRIFR|nr:putative nicotinamide mononucleotide adenylyltransferase [Grifola frondosa]
MSSFSSLIQRIQKGLSAVELVYTTHARWPLPSGPLSNPVLHISVLDASFNPPTLAHLALASAPPPPPVHPISISTQISDNYDAKLLLLSRLEMMLLLAQDIHGSAADPSGYRGQSNIAVAIIDEPTFVGKSSVLLEFLRQRLTSLLRSPDIAASPDVTVPGEIPAVRPQLTFLVGMDTLDRLFSPRYYSSEQAMHAGLLKFLSSDGDDSRLVCARRSLRGATQSEEELEVRVMNTVKGFVESSRVSVVDITEDVRSFSSSEVRELIMKGDHAWRSMVPEKIGNYIMEHRLYRST